MSKEKQIKSKKRVTDHGEVFTNEKEVKSMCDLVNDETERVDSRFLEPACGDGNFLAEILMRKLKIIETKYKLSKPKNPMVYEMNSLIAVSSLYGIDILKDNVEICRERLYKIWEKEYKKICKKECNEGTKKSIKFILSKNIICGNALTLNLVDENHNDLNIPIVFSEWGFVTGMQLARNDYTFAYLLKENDSNKEKQVKLLKEKEDEGIFIERIVTNYRRLADE